MVWSLSENYIFSVHKSSDGGKPVSIAWKAKTPHGTGVKFQFLSAKSKKELEVAGWQGPKGRNSWFTKSSSKIEGVDGRWIQYRAQLNTPNSGATPYLTSVTVWFE